MLIIQIEDSRSDNADGPITLVRVEPRSGDVYHVYASKRGNASHQHRAFSIPRKVDGEQGLYKLLARVFREITL